MMDTGIAIFEQLCQVNDLDPEQVKETANRQKIEGSSEAEKLIRAAFHCKVNILVHELEIGTTSDDETIKEGQEYTISADPAAPSFTINEEYIHSKYSEEEAGKLIAALGKVMLPIRA